MLEARILIALAVGLVVLVLLIAKTKVHPCLAIILVSAGIAVGGGISINEVSSIISKGFGNTLGSIGLVIGFGVMMGQVMEETDAAKVMANSFLKLMGNKHEELALGITGVVVSIPIFADSGFVVLSPLAKAISQKTKKSVVTLGFSLGMGLLLANVCIPPTPGPLGAAGIYGVNIGMFMLFAIAMCVPLLFVSVACAKFFGEKYYRIPGKEAGHYLTREEVSKLTDTPPRWQFYIR